MSRDNHKSGLTDLQRKACRVLIICALALIVTVVAVVALLGRPGKKTNEAYDPNAFRLDTASSAVLGPTDDAGSDYLANTVFVGDSNVVRMNNYGLLTLDQFVGKEGLGIQSVISEACVNFENDENTYTIPQAIVKMKPQRIIVMLGTNNVSGDMNSSEFIADYRQALQAISGAYSYCDIIVAAIPPIPESHNNYPDLQMQTIDEFNQALLAMCESDGYKFLNTSEKLKEDSGYGLKLFFASNDIHFSTDGINELLNYARTHAYLNEDRRPDTDGDRRAAGAQSGGGEGEPAPTQAPEPEESPTPTPTATPEVFKAQYSSGAEGALSCTKDNVSDKSDLSYDVSYEDSLTVTAVPHDGYMFSRWSDGITTASRTDSGFRKDLSVKAEYTTMEVSISISPSSKTVNVDEEVRMVATVTAGGTTYDAAEVEWYDNNVRVAIGSAYPFESPTGGETHKIQAVITVNGVTKTAEATIVVNPASTPVPTPEPTPDEGSGNGEGDGSDESPEDPPEEDD